MATTIDKSGNGHNDVTNVASSATPVTPITSTVLDDILVAVTSNLSISQMDELLSMQQKNLKAAKDMNLHLYAMTDEVFDPQDTE